MGIVVDLQRSSIVFTDPLLLLQQTAYSLDTLNFEFHSFEITFGISFDPDPGKGIGGAPAQGETWKIGIVQNLLWERCIWEYDNNERIEIVAPDPVLDSLDGTKLKPFYGDPYLGSSRRQSRPYSILLYTAKGYGELTNPADVSKVKIDNKPDILSMWDQPGGGGWIKSPKQRNLIKGMERRYNFQAWLVAQTPSDPDGLVLAHVPPFSLCFWLETDLKNFKPKSSFDDPAFDYGVYVENGFSIAKVNRKIKRNGPTPTIQVALGDGGRYPMTFGMTASEQTTLLFTNKGMHP